MANSAMDTEIDQLVQELQAWFGSMMKCYLLPYKCCRLFGGKMPSKYRSVPFPVPKDAYPGTLVLRDDLQIGIPPTTAAEKIAKNLVHIIPTSVLTPGQTAFQLEVNASDLGTSPGGTYWGLVGVEPNLSISSVSHGSGPVTIPVWLVIP
ncbi:MAG TPA: hypothetical protein VEJ87_05025 [Acidimicrobiales bacterium]|nr:hypothetical protein [Acidimicrobiales bacterium]